jgi:hypothetical protein
MPISFRGNTTISCSLCKMQLSLQVFSFPRIFSYAAFEGPVMRLGEVDDGAAVTDLTPPHQQQLFEASIDRCIQTFSDL